MVLLDTCASIWLFERQPMSAASLDGLSAAARDAIRTSPEACISIVTAWEIAIKCAIGKLRMLFLIGKASRSCP